MLNQSFRRTYVTNVPSLLAQGQTVDLLAVGQLAIIDEKTKTAVTAPTYAKNKAFKIAWGTPDVSLGDFFGGPNENDYTPLIKGKLIRDFRVKRAQRPQTPLYTIGWSGDVADTTTLFGKTGESRFLTVRLTGTIIDRLYSTQGLVAELQTVPDCIDECTEICSDVTGASLARQIVKSWNSHKDLKKFTKASLLLSTVPSVTETTCYTFTLTICDAGDQVSLGLVQAKYPTDKVSIKGRNGSLTTYVVTRFTNTLPSAYAVKGLLIPDCTACPTGYTLADNGIVVQVTAPSEATEEDIFTVPAEDPEDPNVPVDGLVTSIQLSQSPENSVWQGVFETIADANDFAENASESFTVTILGASSNICVQNSASSVAWVAGEQLKRTTKKFRITLADSVCGTNRLADLQAAYPNLVITLVNASGSCVHTYEATVNTECYKPGCAIQDIVYTAPQPFEDANWEEVPVDYGDESEVKAGVLIETAFFHRGTNECTFDAFPYENDVVHVQVDGEDPDYNGNPCGKKWNFRQIRGVKYPQGHGAYVQFLEKDSKAYDLRYRSGDPVVRELEGYTLQANPTKYYDQYTLVYESKWPVGGWGQEYSQLDTVNIFVLEGYGYQLEKALVTYITSAGIDIESDTLVGPIDPLA